MPDITVPNTFVSGSTSSAQEVAENIYEPTTPPNTLEVGNGRLDKDNLEAVSPLISHDMVRRSSFAAPRSSGSTANFDFFEEIFVGDGWSLDNFRTSFDRGIGVHGVSASIYTPWPATAVYIAWNIVAIIDDAVEHPGGAVSITLPAPQGKHLLIPGVNGVRLPALARRVKESTLTLVERPTPSDEAMQDAVQPDQRLFSGHLMVDSVNLSELGLTGTKSPLAPGYHTFEVRLASKARHVRIKSCNVTSIPLR
tara:strand:- start:313 stop:1071 length:759 start_codon:yes stop_codon:yes gene_type:complete